MTGYQSIFAGVRASVDRFALVLLDCAAARHRPFDGGAGLVCPLCKDNWPCPELLDIYDRKDKIEDGLS